jgi:POT family proton-dependent oligopeptide transporter
MMGVWFWSISMGEKVAGLVAGTFKAKDQKSLIYLFGGLAVEVILAAIVLTLLTPMIKKMLASADAESQSKQMQAA